MRRRILRPVRAWLCLALLLFAVLFTAQESAAPAVQAETSGVAPGSVPAATASPEAPAATDAAASPEAPAPTAITLTAQRTTIGKKEKLQLVPILYPEGAASAVSFQSSRRSCVSVNAQGVVTGKGTGSATLTATTANGLRATLEITVKKAPASVRIVADRTTLGVGESLQLDYGLSAGSAGAVAFSAPENGVLTVTPEGLVTAVAPGEATVTATTFNGRKKSITMKVAQAPREIHLSASGIRIGVGDEYSFGAEMNEGAPGTFRFSSGDSEIAVIDPITGHLTACKEGQTTITVRAYNGISDSAVVDVLPPPTHIALEDAALTADGQYSLCLRKSARWPVTLSASEYSDISLSLSSSRPDVADVDESGCILAKRSGNAQITVRTYNGLTVQVQLTVEKWTDEVSRLMISHAMGGIDGQNYSNCLEAFLENYAEGHRYFEVDISYTSDGELVLWHSWTKNRINRSVHKGYVPSREEFASMQILDQYTALSLEDLFQLMLQYPDIRIVSDTKETSAAQVKRQFAQIVNTAERVGARSTLERWIVQLYNKEMYDAVESVYPFSRYAMTLYKLYSRAPTKSQMKSIASFCDQRGIDLIVMPYQWWKTAYSDILEAYDVDVALHTVNNADAAQKYFGQGVTAIYTDFLSPGAGY